ncbi:HAMP domain-containing protein [Methyloraptor flagellatus]|uniref:HAMP domain-containing protein n=1 Tax=Methyloraptor flagellatus TaxID=3162530 RepID=A0AAU7XC47_9HYPH
MSTKINLSIRKRVLLLAVLSGLGVASVGGIALWGEAALGRVEAEADTYATLATRARDLKADIFGLRGAATELAGARSGPLIDLFQKRFDETATSVRDLGQLGGAAAVTTQIRALEQRLAEVKGLFDPLAKSYRTLGTSQNDGLNDAVRSAAGEMEAISRAKVLGGGGEAEFRLAYALAAARLAERRYMADHDQELLGEMETAAGRLERAIGRVELDDAEKATMTKALATYRGALAAWVEEDRAAFTTYEKLIGAFDLIAPVLEEIGKIALDGQAASHDALAEARAANARLLLFAAGFVLIGTVVLSLLTGRSISRPLGGLRGAMDQLATGDLDCAIDGTDRRDEIGDMARPCSSSATPPPNAAGSRPSARAPPTSRPSAPKRWKRSCAASTPVPRPRSPRSARPPPVSPAPPR